MIREVELSVKDFSNFTRCLSLLVDLCTDADIRGGILRQMANGKQYIFEMDLRPLISDCDIPIENLKQQLPVLKGLLNQKVQITITVTDDHTYFSGLSTFSFKKPPLHYLDNKFMASEELGFVLEEDNLVLDHVIKSKISRMMKVTADQFNLFGYRLVFEDEIASITASTSVKTHHCEIESGIPLKKPLEGFLNLVREPFLIDRDGNILFKLYSIGEDRFIAKVTAAIGKVAIDVYCGGQLIAGEARKEY
jgi:hypothetical protein